MGFTHFYLLLRKLYFNVPKGNIGGFLQLFAEENIEYALIRRGDLKQRKIAILGHVIIFLKKQSYHSFNLVNQVYLNSSRIAQNKS